MDNTYSPFLSLPAELRDLIYSFTTLNDLEYFAEHTTKPALLRTNKQIHKEYSSIFFASPLLKLETFSGCPPSWTSLHGKEAKQAVFEKCTLRNLTDFWSLGSARRYCQRRFADCVGDVVVGILTVVLEEGLRRWMVWSRRARGIGFSERMVERLGGGDVDTLDDGEEGTRELRVDWIERGYTVRGS